MRIRTGLAVAVVLEVATALAAPAQTVDFRWTGGMGQGVIVAMIRNRADSTVTFHCSSGGVGPVAPALSVEVNGRAVAGEQIHQFVIDGRNHPVSLTDGWLTAEARFQQEALVGIAYALVQSKATAFTVEVPKAGVSESFSLLNVRDALGNRPGSTLADCKATR